MKGRLEEEPDCDACANQANWPLPGNSYAVSVYQLLCTQLNIDYGLAPYIAAKLDLDIDTLRKVNIIWTIASAREDKHGGPGTKTQNNG